MNDPRLETTTELYQATAEDAAFITNAVGEMVRRGKGNLPIVMSFAISLCSQAFLACGGNIEKREQIAEMCRQGMVTTLTTYYDMGRATNAPPEGIN